MKGKNKNAVHRPLFINKSIKKLIPDPARMLLKDTICFGTDKADSLFGRRDPLTPPSKLRVRVGCFFNYINLTNYRAVGEEYARYLKDLCGLKPHHSMLDVGCGCGQIAAPLTVYLSEQGQYTGMDIDGTAIQWCRKNIESEYPNFRFKLIDVFNRHYNPDGKNRACDYTFPFENNIFDFVLLKFVFNHMLPQDVEHYLSEVARVLKKNGKCFLTVYLLNKESLELIDAKQSTLNLQYEFEGCRILDRDLPEYTIAYDEEYFLGLHEKCGMNVAEPIHYGCWCGRKNYVSFFDLVLSEKK